MGSSGFSYNYLNCLKISYLKEAPCAGGTIHTAPGFVQLIRPLAGRCICGTGRSPAIRQQHRRLVLKWETPAIPKFLRWTAGTADRLVVILQPPYELEKLRGSTLHFPVPDYFLQKNIGPGKQKNQRNDLQAATHSSTASSSNIKRQAMGLAPSWSSNISITIMTDAVPGPQGIAYPGNSLMERKDMSRLQRKCKHNNHKGHALANNGGHGSSRTCLAASIRSGKDAISNHTTPSEGADMIARSSCVILFSSTCCFCK